MKRKTRNRMLVVLALVCAAAGYLWLSDPADRPEKGNAGRKARTVERKAARKSTKGKAQTGKKEKPRIVKDHYSAADRRLAEAIQAALEAEDVEATVKAAEAALKSPNPEVRHDAVDALGWFGEKTLPELTVWMADRDEDVAQAAANHWEHGVSEIEDAGERLRVSLFALNTITDEDALSMIGSHFSNAATELIDEEDDEDVASQKRTEVVQALADVIAEGKEQCAAAAREAYEDITGNKWISVDEAEKYLKDPDNYEEPESPDND